MDEIDDRQIREAREELENEQVRNVLEKDMIAVDIGVTNTMLHPVGLAMYGSNNDKIKESLHVRADWLIHDLLRATVRTAFFCIVIIARRRWEKIWQR